MAKVFNVNGVCNPNRHYMVNLESKIREIKAMIDDGEYFTMNRARQYGKTTTLRTLVNYLKHDYETVSIDFQRISSLPFESEPSFVAAFSEELLDYAGNFPYGIQEKLMAFVNKSARINSLQALFKVIKSWCEQSEKPIVLLIDEVDTAANNQVFLDFLSQLRAAYLDRDTVPAFQSVILAGVYDVRNMKLKIRSDNEHRKNSPWNIAAKFRVDMSFSAAEIAGMLEDYENDYHTGMDIGTISELIYDYTSGYPYLVSCLCKNIDEEVAGNESFPDKRSAWTKNGFLTALKLLLNDNNTLFQSLTGKLEDFPKLRTVLHQLLFMGKSVPYVSQNQYIDIASMFGFIKNVNGTVAISNRIFESILYNLFISEELSSSKMYDAGLQERNQFITCGHLDVKKILKKFVETFDYLYGDEDETFLEDVGRRYFMLFLKPIINGIGNSYVEAQTRNHERMDLVIDYRGEKALLK